MSRPEIRCIYLQSYPIWEQLRLEEALIRADDGNWCILNHGSPKAIVMGISGKSEELLNLALLQKSPIPVVRRFSGGGTVMVDANTLFVTFICRHDALPISPCYPEPIMRWTEQLYAPLLPEGLFCLRENDYVLGDHKFGGNAQYLRKDRWLHHSTLLWDYDMDQMNYLLMPSRRPGYRGERPHEMFLCRLRDHLPCPQSFLNSIPQQLAHYFHVIDADPTNFDEIMARPHRQATAIIPQ